MCVVNVVNGRDRKIQECKECYKIRYTFNLKLITFKFIGKTKEYYKPHFHFYSMIQGNFSKVFSHCKVSQLLELYEK